MTLLLRLTSGIIFCLLLTSCSGMDLSVDANLVSPNGTSYPSLSSAISALLMGQNLTEANNSVTILASCVNVTQYFPNNSKIGPSSTGGGGSLKISFINTPSEVATPAATTDQSICNQLPTIVLGSNSTLDLEYLDSFLVEGVTIQYTGATVLNRIYSVGAVNFVHVCWQNYEPSLFLDSSFTKNFTMDSISTFTMSDGIFLYDTLKTLSIWSTNQVNIDSFVFVNLDLYTTYENLGYYNISSITSIPAVTVSSDQGCNTNVTISDLQITCVTCSSVCWAALEVISVSLVNTITMSSITIPSCQLYTGSTVQNIFVIQKAQALIIDKFTVLNLQMQSWLQQELDLLVYISAVKALTISNLNFTNSYLSVWSNRVMFFYISDEASQGDSHYYPMTITFANWVLDAYSNYGSSSLINCTFMTASDFGGALFQDILISSTYLISASYLINFNVEDPNDYTWGVETAYFTINNLTLIDSNIDDYSAVGYFNFYGSTIIEEQEIVGVIMTYLNSTRNTFSSSYFFQIVGMGTYINNSVVQEDLYNSAGYFYSNVQTVGSLVVTNLTTLGLDIQSGSGFILAEALGQRSLQLIGGFQDWDDPIPPGVAENQINYVETRPFLISNSTFIINSITGNSQLITSTNPQVIIEQNIFQVNNLDTSSMMILGNYKIFNVPASSYYYPGYPGSIYPSYPSYYLPFTEVETTFFTRYPALYQLFLDTRTLLALYDPINPVFFISVQQNLFTSIQGQNVEQIISLANFEFPQTTIGILNNSFVNSFFKGDGSSILILCETINRGVFSFNSLSGGDLNGYFFEIQSDYIQYLSFVANTMDSTLKPGFYAITSPQCDTITIQDGMATNGLANWTFVLIECSTLTSQVLLTNLTFKNITRGPTAGELAAVDFIFILNDQLNSTSESVNIILENFTFENITLCSNQFATQSIYESSLIFILTIQADTLFLNDTFNNVLAYPSAGLITLSAPSITLTDSNFQNVVYGSTTGAINAISQDVVMSRCVFESNSGFNIDGAGLLSLSNLDPSNTQGVHVELFTCTFTNNVAPYGTIFYTTTSSLILTIDSVQMINNQVTENGGLIYFFGGSKMQILLTNSSFIQNASYLSVNYYPSLAAILFDSTGAEVSANIENCNLSVTGPSASGVFISVSAQVPVALVLNNTSYSAYEGSNSDSSGNTKPMFGLFKADNFYAQFNYLQAVNVSLNQTSLFTVDCSSASKISPFWELIIDQSVFSSMTLIETLIEVNSDGSVSGALNNLTILIQNSLFSNISWLSSSAAAPEVGNIINSLTSQLGRDYSATPAPSDEFAVTIQNSTFEKLSGSGSLIFTTVESSYLGLLFVNTSNFSNLYSSSGSGGLFNPSTSPLSSFVSPLSVDEPYGNSVVITGSQFTNISAQEGCVLYWQSEVRGFSLSMQENNVKNISCSQNGGILYASNYGKRFSSDQNTSDYYSFLTVILENNNVTDVSACNGGILFLAGETRLLQVGLIKNIFQTIFVAQNGGLLFTSSSNSTSSTMTTGSQNRLLSSSQENQTGTISLSENHIMNIIASNGGVIYDLSENYTLSLLIDSNSFTSSSASQRGGGFYVTEPMLNVTNNNFADLSAEYAGKLIFSVGDVAGLTDLFEIQKNNTIIDDTIFSSEPFIIAYGPTNLKIAFISIQDGSILSMENEDIMPYSPTVSNLTSYSLSEYVMNFTLVYLGMQDEQIVFDESQQIQIGMNFTSLRDEVNNQKFIGHNCTNSVCSVYTNDVILKGLAEDIFLVDVAYNSESFQQSQQFYITLRGCLPGEINQTESEQCIYCRPGTFSLIPTDLECTNCPSEATCNGGSNISINSGYYRSNSSIATLVIVNCNDTGLPRCNGGLTNECKEPFFGPVCLQCDQSAGYVSSGKVAECDQCESKNTLIVYATILIVVTVGYQILMVYVTYNENKNVHEQQQNNHQNRRAKFEIKPGQFMVIFSTFNQLASTFANLDVGTVTSLLGVTENVGNPNTKVVFSLRCLYHIAVPDDDFAGLRFQVFLYVISPLVKVLIVLLFELLRILITKNNLSLKAKIRDSCVKIGAVAVVLTLLEQPGIIGILCAYLSCQPLDPYADASYIEGYNTIQCYTDRYNFFSHLVVIPALIWWAFVMPIIIFLALYKNKEQLHKSLECRLVLGNFYNSYSPESFYWGLVVISLKITIFVLNAVLTGSQVVKAVVFILIIHLYYILLRWRPPFLNHRLMIAEKLCCGAYMILLTLVLFRISLVLEGLRTFCSVLILISIAFAGAYVIINLGILYFAQAKSVYSKLLQKRKDDKITLEIIKKLEEHKEIIGNHHDTFGRRNAIALDLPQRLRKVEQTLEVRKESRRKSRNFIGTLIQQAFNDQSWEEKETPKLEERPTSNQVKISLPNRLEDEQQRVISLPDELEEHLPDVISLELRNNEKRTHAHETINL